MSIIVDLVVIAILVINLLIGYKRGLTGSILKIASFVIAIILVAILYKPVGNLVMQTTNWDEDLQTSIEQMLEGEIKEDGTIEKEESNLPNAMVQYINEQIVKVADEAKGQIIPTVAKDITITIIYAASAVGIFIIARIALGIVTILMKWITELPIIKQVDKTGGIIYGILAGLVIVWIIFAIISFISPMVENTGLIEAISKSYIATIFYNNNLLLQILF